MAEPASSITLRHDAAVAEWIKEEPGRRRDLVLLRAEQQRRDQALKRARCAATYGPSFLGTGTAASSSNTNRPTPNPASTPKDDGEPGPSSRRSRLPTQEQWENGIESRNMLTLRFCQPNVPCSGMHRSGTPSFYRDTKHPNALKAALNFKPMGGPPNGYFAPCPSCMGPGYGPPFVSANITHPNIWCRGTPTDIIKARAPTLSQSERDDALREWLHQLIYEQNLDRSKPYCSNGVLKHADGESMSLLTKARTVTPSNLAASAASRVACTDTRGMPGPGGVVSTVTRSSRREISASEIFQEVWDCVVEYLGSDIAK